MYVAKMTTRYPDYHGTGYYNFLMDEDEEHLDEMIGNNSHDFSHEKTVEIDVEDLSELIEKYPTKEDLNKGEF